MDYPRILVPIGYQNPQDVAVDMGHIMISRPQQQMKMIAQTTQKPVMMETTAKAAAMTIPQQPTMSEKPNQQAKGVALAGRAIPQKMNTEYPADRLIELAQNMTSGKKHKSRKHQKNANARQKGGFLPFLIPLIASAVAGAVGK